MMKHIHERIQTIDNYHVDQKNEQHVWLIDQLRQALYREKLLKEALKACIPAQFMSYIEEEKLKTILNSIRLIAKTTLEHVEYLTPKPSKDSKR